MERLFLGATFAAIAFGVFSRQPILGAGALVSAGLFAIAAAILHKRSES